MKDDPSIELADPYGMTDNKSFTCAITVTVDFKEDLIQGRSDIILAIPVRARTEFDALQKALPIVQETLDKKFVDYDIVKMKSHGITEDGDLVAEGSNIYVNSGTISSKIGINTPSPGQFLHVNGGTRNPQWTNVPASNSTITVDTTSSIVAPIVNEEGDISDMFGELEE